MSDKKMDENQKGTRLSAMSGSSEEGDKSVVERRRLLKASFALTPVLMSLTSRPVHAIQGLSNMLSGDASQCRGDNRYGGMSPGFWRKLTGATDVYADKAYMAWKLTLHDYAAPVPSSNSSDAYDTYSGGTAFNAIFGGTDTRSLREVLNEDTGSDEFHLIAGLLNCRYFEAKAGSGTTLYFMTEDEFWDIYEGRTDLPVGFSSLSELIEYGYHKTPGSECD